MCLPVSSIFGFVFAEHIANRFDASNYDPSSVIKNDDAMSGGSLSGTFAAITIEDLGKSLVVIKKARPSGRPRSMLC